jgi:hypothetical protein
MQEYCHTQVRCFIRKKEVLWLPDPGSGSFLTPYIRDPGWVKKIRIRDEHLRSFFRELGNSFLVKNTLNSLMRIHLQDLFDPGSEMEKLRSGIRYKPPGSATLEKGKQNGGSLIDCRFQLLIIPRSYLFQNIKTIIMFTVL